MFRFWSRLLPFISIVILLLLGCVDGGAQSAIADTPIPVVLPANTSVILHLNESLYKKDAKPGYSLDFEVGYDVVFNGQVVIQNGTAVTGSVRQVNQGGKRPPKVLIDPGAVRAVSGEMVRLVPSSFSSNRESPIAEAAGMSSAAGPILPAFVIASVFEKKMLLDKDAWGGVWEVVQTAENVALDSAKQEGAQEQIAASRKAARAKLCELLASPDSLNWESIERVNSLARRSGLGDSRKADLLRNAGDLDGAIEVYQQLLASGQDHPCSDRSSPDIPSDAPLFLWFGFPEERRGQLWKSFSANSHLAVAELYREKRDFVHAISEYRAAVQLEPENERARIGLIDTLRDSDDFDAAIAESNEAIRIWPDKPYFHYLLGSVLVKKNDADGAIAELQRALKNSKNHLSPANCELGHAFELKDNLEAAFRQYRTAFRARVNDEQCLAAYERLKLRLKK